MRKTTYLLRGLIIIYSLFCGLRCFAQNDTSYFYLSQDLKNTKQNKAVYMGISIKQDDSWHLTVFHITSEKKVLSGYYTDPALESPEGIFETFYDEGERKARGYYHKGMKNGLWKEWDEAGHLTDSAFFENNSAKYAYAWRYTEAHVVTNYSFYDRDSAKKSFKNYTEDGRPFSESDFIGKAGVSKSFHFNGAVFELSRFDETGKRISFQYFKEDGTEMTQKEYEKEIDNRTLKYQVYRSGNVSTNFITGNPAFRGGRSYFNTFVQENLKLPAKFSDGIQTLKFSFYLDKKGKAYNIKILEPDDTELENAVKEVLNNMPPWNMNGNSSYGPIVPIISIKR